MTACLLPAALLAATLSIALDDPKPAAKKGTVGGAMTAKGENWIEVRADGEEKGRRYVAHWRGGAPKDGGGPDKPTVARIRATPVGSRVRLEWSFQERPRIDKLEILKKPAKKKEGARP